MMTLRNLLKMMRYGGWLIFRITTKSLKLVGQEVTDNTRREIAQALRMARSKKLSIKLVIK